MRQACKRIPDGAEKAVRDIRRNTLEAGKKRLAGDTAREATADEVKELKAEARQLKETLAEVLIENRLLKKSVRALPQDRAERILPRCIPQKGVPFNGRAAGRPGSVDARVQ